MSVLVIDIHAIGSLVESVTGALAGLPQAQAALAHGAPSPASTAAALARFLDTAYRMDTATPPGRTDSAAMDQLAAEAFARLDELYVQVRDAGLTDQGTRLARIFPALAVWFARRGAELARLDSVAEAFAGIANSLRDADELAEVCGLMGEVLAAASPAIKADTDRSDPGRPWRILNLNRGIVATRTHDPELMENTFNTLVEYLPQDMPSFFAEGMGQMEALNYPVSVRQVMERYYNEWSPRTVH